MDSTAQHKRWHITIWPPLAWLETVIKAVALAISAMTLLNVSTNSAMSLPEGVRLAQWVILAVLTAGLAAGLADRLIEREIVSITFLLISNVAHWCMALAIVLGDMSHVLALFVVLMLTGNLVKLSYIAVHRDFTVRDQSRLMLYGTTALYVVGYGLILLLEMVR